MYDNIIGNLINFNQNLQTKQHQYNLTTQGTIEKIRKIFLSTLAQSIILGAIGTLLLYCSLSTAGLFGVGIILFPREIMTLIKLTTSVLVNFVSTIPLFVGDGLKFIKDKIVSPFKQKPQTTPEVTEMMEVRISGDRQQPRHFPRSLRNIVMVHHALPAPTITH